MTGTANPSFKNRKTASQKAFLSLMLLLLLYYLVCAEAASFYPELDSRVSKSMARMAFTHNIPFSWSTGQCQNANPSSRSDWSDWTATTNWTPLSLTTAYYSGSPLEGTLPLLIELVWSVFQPTVVSHLSVCTSPAKWLCVEHLHLIRIFPVIFRVPWPFWPALRPSICHWEQRMCMLENLGSTGLGMCRANVRIWCCGQEEVDRNGWNSG